MAHLIGHRADAADAGGDVGHFLETPAAQKGLVKPGRLVDFKLQILHDAVAHGDIQRAFAFHAGQGFYADRSRAGFTTFFRVAHNIHSLV